MKVLVVGASGFIGSSFSALTSFRDVGVLSARGDAWRSTAFSGWDGVLHLAGIAHQGAGVPEASYFEANTTLARAVAERAKSEGVRQLVFASSVKVYGEGCAREAPLEVGSDCHPIDAYGASKLEAEKVLLALADDRFVVTILRLPVVYGPGVKANILSLIRLVDGPWPLPFAGVENRRSVLYVGNLVAAIEAAFERRVGGVLIPTDSEPVSLADLLGLVERALGRRKRWLRVPALASLVRVLRPDLHRRLYGSFHFESASSWARLGLEPPFTTEDGIRDTIRWYAGSAKKR